MCSEDGSVAASLSEDGHVVIWDTSIELRQYCVLKGSQDKDRTFKLSDLILLPCPSGASSEV